MIDVSVEGDNIIFEVEGWDKLWASAAGCRCPSRT